MEQIPVAAPYIKNFEQLAFGMFVHFGLYSQLGVGEWTYSIHRRDMKEYERLMDTFDVDSIKDIVQTAKEAGCKYVNITTRHHEGFSLYDTCGLNTYDAVHSPTGRDVIKEFVEECRREGLVPFFYHTTLDWWKSEFEHDFDAYLDYLYKSVEILCTNYGEIGGIWFDGNWSKEGADWKEERLYKMIRSHQPNAIIINNTGLQRRGEMGVDEIDAVTYERGMPGPLDRRGKRKYMTGEMCETLCDHWGIANDINFKSVKTLIEELCECRKVGANFLLNIGPNADGSVPLMQKATMQCIGHWMSIYGKAIYNGRPLLWYDGRREFVLQDVQDDNTAYLFVFGVTQSTGDTNVSLGLGEDGMLQLDRVPRAVDAVRWMDNGEAVEFQQQGERLFVKPKGYGYGTSLCVRVAEITWKA